ncbi:hypothetical protein SSCG_02250 [Streptomyces clavuligerus]|nr:hypothetical protein SSCG_02250 [Streptomyces clavuligerus]
MSRRALHSQLNPGCIQAMLDAGHLAEKVARHSRHAVSSSAFDAYRKRRTWAEATIRDALSLAA